MAVAALLAAGGGTRFAGPTHKLLAEVRGTPIVRLAYDAMVAAGIGDAVVVEGAVPLADVLPPGARIERNDRWAEGMATSLAVAVSVATSLDAGALVVGLGDQPGVLPAAWRLVADAPDAPIVVATYRGARGNPVRLRRDVWPLLPATGDVGARKLAREQPSLVTAVACPGDPDDVDTVEDLDRWS